MGLKLQKVVVQEGGLVLVCDISIGRPRPVVPEPWGRQIFELVHSLLQPVVRACIKLVGSNFDWPGLHKDVKEWSAACGVSAD